AALLYAPTALPSSVADGRTVTAVSPGGWAIVPRPRLRGEPDRSPKSLLELGQPVELRLGDREVHRLLIRGGDQRGGNHDIPGDQGAAADDQMSDSIRIAFGEHSIQGTCDAVRADDRGVGVQVHRPSGFILFRLDSG